MAVDALLKLSQEMNIIFRTTPIALTPIPEEIRNVVRSLDEEFLAYLAIADGYESIGDLKRAEAWRWLAENKKAPTRVHDLWKWTYGSSESYFNSNSCYPHVLPYGLGAILADWKLHRSPEKSTVLRNVVEVISLGLWSISEWEEKKYADQQTR